MRYWNPTKEACYIQAQLRFLSDVEKLQLVEIEDSLWNECIRKNHEEGMEIHNDPVTNRPITTEPETV